jgi:hypothetical protein
MARCEEIVRVAQSKVPLRQKTHLPSVLQLAGATIRPNAAMREERVDVLVLFNHLLYDVLYHLVAVV